jgi:4-amino-4-deoxy-L-arabinose transferase-like glycosyltransferase
MSKKFTALLEYIRKNSIFVFLFLSILAFGIFLRSYNFSPWLHYEVDQTWDYTIVSNAIQHGPGSLPLLGPTAGGGRALRLGPSFYYLEYLSALIFGNTPQGHAANVLVFSILTLPLFYLFYRRYFSREVSLGLLAIASTSYYLVAYSRFSWSPNVLPFFILLSFYALLKCVSKEEKHPARWFLVMVTIGTITSQIHFNAFFTISAIILVFLVIKRPRFSLKLWAAAIGIVFLIYSPMICNEIKSHGEDTLFFFQRVSNPGNHVKPFVPKAIINIQYNVYEYFLVISGNDQINSREPDGSSFGLSCKKDCGLVNHVSLKILALIYFILGLLMLVINTAKEKFGERKDFLVLTLLWFVFSFLYFFKIYDSNILFPRFFLIIAPLAIIFLGFILELLRPEKNKLGLVAMSLLIIGIVWTNTSYVFAYFGQLRNVSTLSEDIKLKDVFPFTVRATFQLQQQVADYIASKATSNGYPVYIQCDHEYAATYWYLLNQMGIQESDDMSHEQIPENGNYFLITRTSLSKVPLEDIAIQKFRVANTHVFGSITVYTLNPQVGAHLSQALNNSLLYVTTQKEQISNMLTWKKLFQPYSSPQEIVPLETTGGDNQGSLDQ